MNRQNAFSFQQHACLKQIPAGADDDTERSDRGDISHDKGKLRLRCPLAVYCCDGGSETNRASHLCQLTVYLEDICRRNLAFRMPPKKTSLPAFSGIVRSATAPV